jgi:hypothetical protein
MKMAAHKEARFFVRSQRSGYQLSAFSSQLSVVSYELSVITYWLLAGFGPPP